MRLGNNLNDFLHKILYKNDNLISIYGLHIYQDSRNKIGSRELIILYAVSRVLE